MVRFNYEKITCTAVIAWGCHRRPGQKRSDTVPEPFGNRSPYGFYPASFRLLYLPGSVGPGFFRYNERYGVYVENCAGVCRFPSGKSERLEKARGYIFHESKEKEWIVEAGKWLVKVRNFLRDIWLAGIFEVMDTSLLEGKKREFYTMYGRTESQFRIKRRRELINEKAAVS